MASKTLTFTVGSDEPVDGYVEDGITFENLAGTLTVTATTDDVRATGTGDMGFLITGFTFVSATARALRGTFTFISGTNGRPALYFINGGSFYSVLYYQGQQKLQLYRSGVVVDEITGLTFTSGSKTFEIRILGSVVQVFLDGSLVISYTDGTPLTGLSTLEYDIGIADGLGYALDNLVISDIPTKVSGTINAAGTTFTLLTSEPVTVGAGGNGGMALTLSGGACTATYASGSGTTSIVYTLSRVPWLGETGTFTYTQPGNGLENSVGIDLGTITAAAITNNSTVVPATPTGLVITSFTPTSLELDWDDPVVTPEWWEIRLYTDEAKTELYDTIVIAGGTTTEQIDDDFEDQLWVVVYAIIDGVYSAASNTATDTPAAGSGSTRAAMLNGAFGFGF